jgi:DNA polymerase III subunit chi
VTEVAFHTGIADKLGYTCRMLRKAYRQGVRVVVRGDAAELGRLDAQLWTFEQLEFVPHARLRPGEPMNDTLARTPIWLVDEGAVAPHFAVLVNLGPRPVDRIDGYERVIEIVGEEAADRQAGRQRWRLYERQGQAVTHVAPGVAVRDDQGTPDRGPGRGDANVPAGLPFRDANPGEEAA